MKPWSAADVHRLRREQGPPLPVDVTKYCAPGVPLIFIGDRVEIVGTFIGHAAGLNLTGQRGTVENMGIGSRAFPYHVRLDSGEVRAFGRLSLRKEELDGLQPQ